MKEDIQNFIQSNSSDRGFLQSEEWRKFQESAGRKTFHLSDNNFSVSIIDHNLPIAGKYFYVPRGPVFQSSAFPLLASARNSSKPSFLQDSIYKLINLAKENKAGWIRIEPENKETLEAIKNNIKLKIKKSPHDMQPREILMLDITKLEEELLAEMKSKTRYNIRLSEKKGVKTWNMEHGTWNKKYIDEFLRLVKITAKRDGITSHPENYYRQMFETIPDNILELYVAEYEGKIIAANLIIFYGKVATYLHGASDNEHRNLMAPYLLQWRAIQDAKKAGCEKYDFGGIKSGRTAIKRSDRYNSWSGITKFKTGFAPNTKPVEFPGCYDIIISPIKYKLYRIMQKIKSFL